MPQHKSAKKRMKTNVKRQLRNKAGKSSLKTALKKYKSLSGTEKAEGFKALQSDLDKAAKKGAIHKKRASRLKSRLSP
ncbi:MAG: 30S ribosomal protein S20 [Chitinivibrionia bacterium]|nr:30S ribosomal protein S20 [Chitinivibrionia bacterium]